MPDGGCVSQWPRAATQDAVDATPSRAVHGPATAVRPANAGAMRSRACAARLRDSACEGWRGTFQNTDRML